MLDKFQQKFVEEAQDNIVIIEESLFDLEREPENKEIIERLFRAMHTIKGSGAMFGFNDLSHFTHNLETLYDLIRNDKLAVSKDIISLTFESLDYIRLLLDVGEGTLTDPADIQRQKDYIAKITHYFPEGQQLTLSSKDKARLAAQQATEAAKAKEEEKGPRNYLVTFTPFESLLNNGTNPLFMLDDLTALGEYKTVAFTGAVPALDKLEPLNLYAKWQVILSTEQDENEIQDVFIFVEDECKMEIKRLPNADILGDTEKLHAIISRAVETQTELTAEDFADFKPKETNKEEGKGPRNYLVTFAPFESLLNNGTNPLFMLDDLTALGEYKTLAFTSKVPALDKLEPLNLYAKWQVILSTEQDENEIQDVFIFVEDECKMEVKRLPNADILGDSDKLTPLISRAIETQTELKAEDFADFKPKAKPQEVAQQPAQPTKSTSAPAAKPATTSTGGAAKPQDNKISSIRVSSDKIDDLVNAVSELVTMQAQLNLLAGKQDDQSLISIAEQMEKITRQLRENSFSISLIPLQGELIRFQRLVRDLCNKLGKQMEFVVEGGEIELDKNIIDHLTDPLLHIIRNSGDHGIEMPEERVAKGKNPTGTILLKAFYSGSSVVVQVSDDGKGMDPAKIFKKAVEKGIVDPNANLSKKDTLNLIFASGFSTAEKISDVSGRGVGMDVVKSKIAEIRGEVTIDSEVDKGTTISMELPMTLSIIDGLLTKINGEQYVFPLSNVERILQPSEVAFSPSGMGNFFTYDGQQMIYLDLNKIFDNKDFDRQEGKLLIVGQGDKRVGMLVDVVIGEYQIVVKPLGRFLRSVDMISGASVMGDGSLSLIIDTGRLINYYNQLRIRRKE